MATLNKNKKKYLGIITSFTNLKNGLLQIHEQLVNELSKNFEKVYLINDQNLRFFPNLSRKIYLEELENEKVHVPYCPKNFVLFNPKSKADFDLFLKDKELFLINNIGRHFFDLGTYICLKKNNIKHIIVSNLGVPKPADEKPDIKYFKNFLIFHFNQTIFKKITVLLSNIGIVPKVEIRFVSDKTILNNIYKSSIKKFLYNNKLLFSKEIIEVNSRTYDYFLKNKVEISEDLIVHLDAGLNIRHEIQFRGKLSEDNIKKHYYFLKEFLKKLADQYKKKIIISIHPAYDLEEHKKYFEDIEVVKYKTRELICRAFLVTHFDSSAVTDAIFLNKRLMSLESNFMSLNERLHSRSWSDKLGYEHLNTESDFNFNSEDLLKKMNSNIQKYGNYNNNYHCLNSKKSGTLEIVEILKKRFFVES